MTILLAIAAGALIGLSLGALGGGGSILAVPILVYVVGQDASQATTGSLVVGVTSMINAVTAHQANGRRAQPHPGHPALGARAWHPGDGAAIVGLTRMVRRGPVLSHGGQFPAHRLTRSPTRPRPGQPLPLRDTQSGTRPAAHPPRHPLVELFLTTHDLDRGLSFHPVTMI